MHFITIKKSDSVVVDYRIDTSIPPYWTNETLSAAVAKDRNLPVIDLETVSMNDHPGDELGNLTGPLVPFEHCFDTMTNLARNNPNYVQPVIERRWNVSSIRPHLSLAERVKWDNDKTDTIKTAKIELAPGLLEPEATEVLQLLVDAGDISAASMQKILA